MNNKPLVFVGIAPHPPVMVPDVGGAMANEVRASIDALRDLTERIKASGAETVIIISPHAPLEASAFVAYDGPQLRGDFANFRAPQAIVEAPLDEELLDTIKDSAMKKHFPVVRLKSCKLDHGTAVPLYFLFRNGWRGRVVALGYSFLSNEDHILFGKCVARAVEKVGRSVAFIASGDLSHRLTTSAPAGFHPNAHLFDQEVVEALRAGEPERIININSNLRRLAGECGYRSMLVAFGVAVESEPFYEVLHYEAPFGVGYLVAQITRSNLSGADGVIDGQIYN